MFPLALFCSEGQSGQQPGYRYIMGLPVEGSQAFVCKVEGPTKGESCTFPSGFLFSAMDFLTSTSGSCDFDNSQRIQFLSSVCLAQVTNSRRIPMNLVSTSMCHSTRMTRIRNERSFRDSPPYLPSLATCRRKDRLQHYTYMYVPMKKYVHILHMLM